MRYAVKAVMRYSTIKVRDSARTSYKRNTKSPPAMRTVDLIATEDVPVWVIADGFALLTDREAALTTLTSDLNIVDGSRIQAHNCFHDEALPQPCTATAEWRKVGGLLTKVV